jgi:hypothetical protein
MRPLSPIELVEVWEEGCASGAATRAHLLLSRTHPELSDRELDAMPLGVRDGLLMDLRQHLFGSTLESVLGCPRCGESLEIAVDVNELQAGSGSRDGTGAEWTGGDLSVRFRVPTSGDLRDLEECRDSEEVHRRLLERCVLEAHRGAESIGPSQLMPEEAVALGEQIAHADPRAELMLETRCPNCGCSWDSLLDIASFLWHELDIHVRRLVAEVHTLASAYSWSERDILAMSARRRQLYLEELLTG